MGSCEIASVASAAESGSAIEISRSESGSSADSCDTGEAIIASPTAFPRPDAFTRSKTLW